jgi:hypothetical protein
LPGIGAKVSCCIRGESERSQTVMIELVLRWAAVYEKFPDCYDWIGAKVSCCIRGESESSQTVMIVTASVKED